MGFFIRKSYLRAGREREGQRRGRQIRGDQKDGEVLERRKEKQRASAREREMEANSGRTKSEAKHLGHPTLNQRAHVISFGEKARWDPSEK